MYTLCKAERLSSKIMIEKMFSGNSSRSFSIYPLRVVYMFVEQQPTPASILISVPKKRFKRAVKRNLIKRQVREAYRKHKEILWQLLADKDKELAIAFIYLSNELISSAQMDEKVKLLLTQIAERKI